MAKSSGLLKSADGSASAHANGKRSGRSARRTTAKPRRGFLAWLLGLVARLAIWAAIFTVLFRCPSSLDACDDNSPFVCRYYFRAKHVVSPHLEPYYDQYAAPYVHVAKPYYDTVNSHVLTPTRVYAVYYGAPWVKRGQDYVWSQWETKTHPQLARLQVWSQAHYDQLIAPHLLRAGETVGPYYEIARTNSLQLFYEYMLPSYGIVRPYAAQGYDAVSHFTTNTALPGSLWAWNKANVFFKTALWPHLRTFYVENVEPQLVRIGERLGRYKNKAKTKVLPEQSSSDSTAAEPITSSFNKPTPQTSTPPATTITEAYSTDDYTGHDDAASAATQAPDFQETTEEHTFPVKAPPADESESEVRQKARKMVAHDLQMWQEKFSAKADDGATELEDHVDEIARLMIEKKAQLVGKSLVEQLESTVGSELANLKRTISSIVQKGPEGAEENAISAIRAAGVAIKKKAQMIRGWREEYLAELRTTVLDAANVHYEILYETRTLALQEIGMRWSWTEGISYKDWAKYRELKTALTLWTEKLEELVVTHPSLLEAQDVSAQIEDEGMAVASAAARELARLKEVARWKILAKDSTDSFDSDSMKLAAEAAQDADRANESSARRFGQAKSVVKDASEQGSLSAEELSSAAEEAVRETIPSVAGAAATSSIDEAADVVSEAIEDETADTSRAPSGDAFEMGQDGDEVLEKAPPAVEGDSPRVETETIFLKKVEPAVSTELPDTPSVIIIEGTASDEEEEPAERLTMEASETLAGDTIILGDNTTPEKFTSTGDGDLEDAKGDRTVHEESARDAEATPIAAVFGAAAQSVSERRPVLEDDVDSDIAVAQAAFSSVVSVASDRCSSALSVVSAHIHGTPKPVHAQLLSSVSAAYDKAVAAASHKLGEAVDAASSGVYGKATPTKPLSWERVESMAAQRLNEGRLWAEIQYQSALIVMGVATPTPTSTVEKIGDKAKLNYYARLGLAQDQYTSFISAASSAWSSMTATPTPTDLVGSASSVASVASESASSAAHAAGEAAHSVYSAATDGVLSAAEAVEDTLSAVADAAEEQMYIAGAAVAKTWDKVVSELSSQVYGEPTAVGWYDKMIEGACPEAVSDRVALATDAAQAAAVTASAKVARQYEAVSEIVSELVSGREPAFSESVLSRLSAAYVTAAASVGSLASEASVAAASVGDRVGSSASRAAESGEESVRKAKDEL